jgi:purine-binding chemotaxis protein CheW
MPEPKADPVERSAARSFVTFRVAERRYALPAEDVVEVRRVPPMARVPQSPPALLGIANLRGSVLPIASLRGLLGMKEEALQASARAIVLDVGSRVAIVVDAVDELVNIESERIERAQAELSAEPGERLTGSFQAAADGRAAKILDIKGLLDGAFAQRARSERQVRRGSEVHGSARDDVGASNAEMLVTFEIAGQEFALDLDAVQEIIPAPATTTAVPRTETLVLGVTSLRGTLLPLLSLRALLGFPLASGASTREKVVVMNVGGARVGLVADRARAIVAAEPELVDPVPAALSARLAGESQIRAIYRGEGGRRLISIIEPERLFREDVMQRLNTRRQGQEAPAQAQEKRDDDELNFLVFRLGGDEFALPIDTVDEVAQVPQSVTRVPKTPKFLEGVVNLRGTVLPVIDQRRRFDMPKADQAKARRLVVVRTERHRAGVIVDSVSDVLRVPASAVEPAPELTEGVARLVRGVINLQQSGRIVLLLDPLELLTRAERGLLDAFQAENQQAGA